MSVSDFITYEHPLNERSRTFLRLEHLFQQTNHFLQQADHWNSRAAIGSLLDIVSIFSRYELKKEILKELERQAGNLERIRLQPGVDIEMLSQVLDDLEYATHQVYNLNGKVGQKLRENEFLMAIMQRSSIPGGSCTFDLPQYHYWLTQPYEIRQRQMREWFSDFEPIYDAITLLLSLIRNSSTSSKAMAKQGFYQQTLEPQNPAQLIQIGLSHVAPYYPEVSGTKNRFNVRFLASVDAGRPVQTSDDVEFILKICMI